MLQTLIEGLILGFSTGSLCLITCTPIYLPYLISEDRKLSKGILAVLEISAGRFFSYLAFGAFAGYAGAQISSVNREIFTSIAYILLSAYLVLSAVRTRNKQKKCHVPKLAKFTKSAFVLGVLTGINFCPSFLIALSKAVDLGGALSGMALFLGFFLGTSVFLIPLAFIGQISKISKMKMIAQIASIFIAVWFTFTGVKGLVHISGHMHTPQDDADARIVEAFHPNIPVFIFSTEENADYFQAVRDSAAYRHLNKTYFSIYSDAIVDTLKSGEYTLLLDDDLLEDIDIEQRLEKFDYFYIEAGYDLPRMMKFLSFYTFKTHEQVHWQFKEEEK
jgi:sulfite exporter TauE/SafE